MSDNRPPRERIADISFRIYNSEEIRRISVKEIDRPETFDELQHPVSGGLYDPAMGTIEMFEECASCGCRDRVCPGHIGHIELSLPVYNPMFFSFAFQLLRGTCFQCHRVFSGTSSIAGRLIVAQLRCLERGLITAVHEIQAMMTAALTVRSEDLTPGDADEGERPSKRKSAKMSAAEIMEEGFDTQAEEKLQELLEEALRKEKTSTSSEYARTTRNVQVVRQSIVREFCSRFLFNRRRKCPHCRTTSQPLAARSHQVILIGSMRKKQPEKKEVLGLDTPMNGTPASAAKSTPARGRNATPKSIKQETESIDGMPTQQLDTESVQELISGMVSLGTDGAGNDGRRILSPIEARQHLRQVWDRDGDLLKAIYPLFADDQIYADSPVQNDSDEKYRPTDLLFCDVIPVPPSQFRPVAHLGGMKFENRQTAGFRNVLELNAILKHFVQVSRGGGDELSRKLSEQVIARVRGATFTEKLQTTYIELQIKVNGLFDSALSPVGGGKPGQSVTQPVGLRQILEKKEGMIRMNMMGKRVNFACRTVITPDPYMDVDGIGIPDIFALKLTFPTPVNQLNVNEMRRAVVNGPKNYPGANFAVSEFGQSLLINDSNIEDRKSIAKRLLTNDNRALSGPKKVLRHLLPGDYMLLNRQPTLHKPSIMSHKVHILRNQRTLRLNYATCKSYNADFDGDEMNAHLPQDLLCQAECQEIMNVIHQYLVPKDGTPISGLIQDHIVSGVLLTLKDKFFSKEDYEYLVLSAFGFLKRKLRTLPPTIWKPAVRWTGKQIVSTVILNLIPDGYPLLSLDGKAKTALKNWQVAGHGEPDFSLSDSHIVFRNCELLVGVLDKNHYGPTPYGLVHCCYELYGPRVACNLLSCFSRLFTTYLQLHGFSFGVADILVDKEADKKRKELIENLDECGDAVMREVFRVKVKDEEKYARALEECYSKSDRGDIKQLDFCMKSQTDKVNDKVNKACLPHGLLQLFPNNALMLMIECGAKGNMVNSMQMSCMLGQIELEGSRPAVTHAGRSLPSFKEFDSSPRAGGFVAQRFLTGVKPQEFFFHCMAGREGLIDTAVKTSRSGYLQRCIIKHLESVVVGYDLTVRDADQSVIQFRYGEDGLDIGKVQFLQDKQLPFLLENFEVLRASLPSSEKLDRFPIEDAEKHFSKIRKWMKKDAKKATTGRQLRNGKRCPDPVAAVRNPCTELGVLPEHILLKLEELRKSGLREDVFEDYRRAIYWKGVKAMVEPGEAVGLLAAQSIGEPSTQMTLNTFHFAGRGEMNVTLGIPRLREILMTASEKITTPAAQVPFAPHVSPDEARELHRRLNNVFLDKVLLKVDAQEKLTRTAREEFREYTVVLGFSKRQTRPYASSHLGSASVLRAVERGFIKRVAAVIKKICDLGLSYERSRMTGREQTEKQTMNKDDDANNVPEHQPRPVADDEDGMSDEEMDKGGEDAADERLRKRNQDDNEYMGEEEEQAAVGDKEDDDEGLNETETSPMDETSNSILDIDDEDVMPSFTVDVGAQDASRVKAVLSHAKSVLSYEYDVKKSRWCRFVLRTPARFGSIEIGPLILKEAQRFPVQGIPGVTRCILSEVKGQQVLITEGVNLQAFFEHADQLDVNKIYCNHIHVVANTYGIEAALKALIKETQNVFGSYGIVVDYRHLSLVADYMMHTGSYRPFNRMYMGTSTSPLQKMSFETTMKFLKDAVEAGEKDHLTSTSASIVAGQMPKVGTGIFDVMVKLK